MRQSSRSEAFIVDRTLLSVVMFLLLFGLLMVASASMPIAKQEVGEPLYFFYRQSVFISIGLIAGLLTTRVSMQQLKAWSIPIWMLSLLLLLVVLIPGIGRTVNGSARWIPLGLLNLQPSELAKISLILFLSHYLSEHRDEVFTNPLQTFARPFFLMMVMLVLVLLEPDFGAVVVMSSTAFALAIIGGMPWQGILAIMCSGGVGFGILAISAPYRLSRLTAFLDPWADQFNTGYQLTQALIAFGRGEWFGLGIGSSVQKLFYLPEAHTDFLFAVVAEELGFFGGLTIIISYGILVGRGLYISYIAFIGKQLFEAYLAFGLTFWIGMQAVINIGVNMGLLPTKGLTLPFMSSGGSSLLVSSVAVGILMRIYSDSHQRLVNRHAV